MTYTTITTIWTGATGLPGYTRHRFEGELDSVAAAAAAERVQTFWEGIMLWLPIGCVLQVQPDAQQYDNNGELSGVSSFTPPGATTGMSTGSYAAPVGACITWLTNGVEGGRKVKGRTFLVPLSGGSFQNNGTLADNARADFQAAANVLRGGTPALVIAATHKVLGVVTGVSTNPVTGSIVADKAAILTSRRD